MHELCTIVLRWVRVRVWVCVRFVCINFPIKSHGAIIVCHFISIWENEIYALFTFALFLSTSASTSATSFSFIFQLGWRRFFLGFQCTVCACVCWCIWCAWYTIIWTFLLNDECWSLMRTHIGYMVEGSSWYSYRDTERHSFSTFSIESSEEEIRKTETDNPILHWITTWVHIRAFWLWSLAERAPQNTAQHTRQMPVCVAYKSVHVHMLNAWNTRLSSNTHTHTPNTINMFQFVPQ